MSDILCTLMGVFDIIAGCLIMFAFGFNPLAMVFGILMIGKGAFSFI